MNTKKKVSLTATLSKSCQLKKSLLLLKLQSLRQKILIFLHHGIDFDQLKESFLIDIKERRFARGASTLTMQTARTLFLSTDKTITRKIQEAIITLIMEIVLPKKRIFALYLNYAELGEGIYGVEAASQYYYHKSSSNLSAYQSILLAATISAPHISNCAHPDARLQHRAKVVYNKVRTLPPETKKAILGK